MSGLPIGQVAKRFGIDNSRLREWCKRGLIEADMRSNTRYISEEEFPKIEIVKKFFDNAKKAGTRVTFEDAKEELEKVYLFESKAAEEQQHEMTKVTEEALYKALGGDQLMQVIQYMGEQVTLSKEETVTAIVELQKVYTESMEKQLNSTKEENEMLKSELKEIKEMVGELHQGFQVAATTNEEEQKEQKPGFFKRLFGM